MRNFHQEHGLGRLIYACCVVGLFLFSGTAWSAFPERPVTLVIGSEPGGPIDLAARALAASSEKYLGKPIVPENKGGGGGTVAAAIVATAKPDGYTLCATPNISFGNTPLMQKVTFKPLKSFTAIVGYAIGEDTALLVKSDAPWKTAKEFFAYAKNNPGKVKYSSAGIGMSVHVVMETVARKEGIKWVHVPYKGAAPALTALLGGHVDACSAATNFVPQAKAGLVRVLATHGRARSPHFPEVPTFRELGYDAISETIHSVVGPASLPAEIVQKLESSFLQGMEAPEFKETLQRIYLSPMRLTAREYDQHLKEFWFKYEKIFKEMGLIAEPATQPY
jgi:tripartite-type tricarboxylate transporter receptor subunit TctC